MAKEANHRFAELLHGETNFLDASPAAIATPSVIADTVTIIPVPTGGIATEEEELEVEAINNWLETQGLPRGQINFELSDETTGEQRAVLDLAWPDGLQPGLTIPVAVLLNEPNEVLSIASAAGYRCFPTKGTFRAYVNAEILGVDAEAA